jgi:hypothetical protein
VSFSLPPIRDELAAPAITTGGPLNFETLIEKARQAAASERDWDESAFSKARMEDKIEMLRQHLPKFLVENRKFYGIMSVGVHTLSEADCLAAFPVVRVGIELMLDEQLEK